MSLSLALSLLEAEVGRAYPAAALGFDDGGRERLLCTVGEAGLATWFDLASLTKALCTSLVAMRLCAAGRLSLSEEPLPGVSVEDLLRHQGGLPAWRPLYEAAAAQSPALARAAVIAAARGAERGPRGVREVYSDLGFIVLADFLEQRGEARLDEQFSPIAADLSAEVGFRPLGVGVAPASACAPTRTEAPERALLVGVVHDDNARAMGGVAGHAGLFGTPRGVARMARGLCAAYHGEEPALPIPAALLRHFFAPPSLVGATFGLGWDHPDPDAARSSAGALWPRDGVGHLGFTGCSLWLDPGARRFALLLSNRAAAETAALAAESKDRMKALRPRVHDALLS